MPLITKAFGDIITFERATTGTFFNSAGVLTSAAINTPRLDYSPSTLAAQGLLIEEQRANLLTYSDQFNDASWGKTRSTITANAITSPDGTVNADKLVEDTSNNTHLISKAYTDPTGTTLTLSVFCKSAERTNVFLQISDNATGAAGVSFNLATGTYQTPTNGGPFSATTGAIINTGNGWYRCILTTTRAGAGTAWPYVSLQDGANTSYTGNGTSGLYIWGAQLEAGAFPTSYIPTTTAAVTRSADVASVNTLSPWFNATEGTLYGEFSVTGYAPSSAFPSTATFSDNTAANRISMISTNLGANLYSYGEVISGGTSQAGFYGAAGSTFGTATIRKLAIAYAANNFAFTTQGLTAQTDTSGVVPTVDRLYLAVSSVGSSQWLNGYLRRITYYPRRLTNAELQAITA